MAEKEEKKTTAKKAVKKTTTKKETAKKTTTKKATAKTTAKKTVAKKTTTKKEATKTTKVVKKEKSNVVSKKKARKQITFSLTGKKYFYAVGKRKTSVARVRLYEGGSGKVEINGKDIKDYFFGILGQNALFPAKLTETQKSFDITVKVLGGGVSAQADATRHGIARALVEADPEFRSVLKKAGLLSRDSRVKERKKPGLKGARRAPQWQKR